MARLNIQNIGVGRVINQKTVKVIFTGNGVKTEVLITDPTADLRTVRHYIVFNSVLYKCKK